MYDIPASLLGWCHVVFVFYATAVFVNVSPGFYDFVTRGFNAVNHGKQRRPQSVSN